MFGFHREKWQKINGFNTAREIYQQPKLWLEVLKEVESNKANIDDFIKERLNKDKVRVIFSGAGTSGFIGEILTPHLNKKVDLYQAIHTTDIVANPQVYFKRDIPTILVSFARSGNSPESVAAYNLANQLIDNISHIFITCNEDGELAKIAENNNNILSLLMPKESNDKGFAMTGSFSCMTLAASLIFDIDNLKNNKKMVEKMVSMGEEILENGYEKVKEINEYEYDRVVYLGSGSFHGLTKESGLKLLELTRGQIISHSNTPLGFRHGPKSIVDNNTLIYIYISDDPYSRRYDLDLLNEIYHDEGKHRVIAVSNNYDRSIEEISHEYIYLSKDKNDINNPVFLSLLFALYAQVFSLLSSVKSNIEPDNPSPSGSVNRVVKGVTIYEYIKRGDK